ncbi:putative S-adenosylmethionine-dependent methyltransferase-like [Capsicum annuum]|uniref:Uncharacterized protein n=1 Tax=Capsicum annuum TaxID=4072 RepID=A0A2G3A9I6_CAPAN|nr:putative S-adenosylmethionine-dependent methyltransferase-like [Capsicum annuum]KAF3664325.1 putative S-adenosylmethionine-dependent methyltransferase-like [Capsicum annuum]PHT90833.1 hypothetical protein T459_05946 [Capsicum annuum]
MLSSSNTLCIADFGCSVGPKIFIAMQHVLPIDRSYYAFGFSSSTNEGERVNLPKLSTLFIFGVNSIFSLPLDFSIFLSTHFHYYEPNTFHGRLFPSRSIHFAHCSCAIHWLSKCPEELLDEKSPAWNKGLIHYIGTSNVEVLNAYVAQFEKDMEMLLNARAELLRRLLKVECW